jgi:hypothetical protein
MKQLIALTGISLLAGAAAAQPAPRMEHPQMLDLPIPAARPSARTAEQMRAGSAWGTYGGLSGDYSGMGGPDESEEQRVYPRCRSRSDDRCRQGR